MTSLAPNRRLKDFEARSIFEFIHYRTKPPRDLPFQVHVSTRYTPTKLSPPSWKFQPGLYVIVKDLAKSEEQLVPPHLQDKVMPTPPSGDISWTLSGPQFPKPSAIQQRYCYPKGNDRSYCDKISAVLWTACTGSGEEDVRFRLLQVYHSAKWVSNNLMKQAETTMDKMSFEVFSPTCAKSEESSGASPSDTHPSKRTKVEEFSRRQQLEYNQNHNSSEVPQVQHFHHLGQPHVNNTRQVQTPTNYTNAVAPPPKIPPNDPYPMPKIPEVPVGFKGDNWHQLLAQPAPEDTLRRMMGMASFAPAHSGMYAPNYHTFGDPRLLQYNHPPSTYHRQIQSFGGYETFGPNSGYSTPSRAHGRDNNFLSTSPSAVGKPFPSQKYMADRLNRVHSNMRSRIIASAAEDRPKMTEAYSEWARSIVASPLSIITLSGLDGSVSVTLTGTQGEKFEGSLGAEVSGSSGTSCNTESSESDSSVSSCGAETLTDNSLSLNSSKNTAGILYATDPESNSTNGREDCSAASLLNRNDSKFQAAKRRAKSLTVGAKKPEKNGAQSGTTTVDRGTAMDVHISRPEPHDKGAL